MTYYPGGERDSEPCLVYPYLKCRSLSCSIGYCDLKASEDAENSVLKIPIITSDKEPKDTVRFINNEGKEVGRIENIMSPIENGSPEFYRILNEMENIHRLKSYDYAQQSNPFSNFERSGLIASWFKNPVDIAFASLIGVKLARLAELSSSNKTPNNESVADTHLDLATYCALWAAYKKSQYNQTIQKGIKITEQAMGGMDTSSEYTRRKEMEQKLDQSLRAEGFEPISSVPRLTDYKFHNALRTVINSYGIDSELNIADQTIVLKIIDELIKWKHEIS